MAGAGVRAELPLAPHLRLTGGESLEDALALVLELAGEAAAHTD